MGKKIEREVKCVGGGLLGSPAPWSGGGGGLLELGSTAQAPGLHSLRLGSAQGRTPGHPSSAARSRT